MKTYSEIRGQQNHGAIQQASPRRRDVARYSRRLRQIVAKAAELAAFADRVERIEAAIASDVARKQKVISSAPVDNPDNGRKSLPRRIKVLYLAANPINASNLRLDEEYRVLEAQLRQAKYRGYFKLEAAWAVRPQEVLAALNEYQPTVVHFSGHGSLHNELALLDDEGRAMPISQSAIVEAIAAFESVRLVFFNACHSRDQASAVVKHVEAAVGMNRAVGDTAARQFASQFYSALAYGCSIKHAFAQAKTLLMMLESTEVDTPELFVADGLDPGKITLVRRRRPRMMRISRNR